MRRVGFQRILVANRGEIACRIFRTARRLGVATVAVYSEADRAARHVAAADEAFLIGPAPARESYLDGAKILDAAKRAGADAIHPGYGFLAENADFAERCARAGVIFIGPSPEAIRAMGDKARAKALMSAAGVPMVPGYFGEDQDPRRLADEAQRIGFPVLIKPSAGGGGKGMKVVTGTEDLVAALASAKREASASFGDDRVMLEKYLEKPRHVEVQIFGDTDGHIVHLFDRDCSTQRRHQKIIEEAPAPDLPDGIRQAIYEAAIAAARSVAYSGAGTVEFLFTPTDGAFYFLEMNTRLQVEHPVTEMITGLDLVEWQIRVAEGATLPVRQETILYNGHAIEARLYAEDPERDFLPQAGTLERADFPSDGPGLRVDTGFGAGDTISIHYDPMIAKLVAHGKDRNAAMRLLGQALGETRIVGLGTNLGFLRELISHDIFTQQALDTGFIDRDIVRVRTRKRAPNADDLALAILGLLCAREGAPQQSVPADPWDARDDWRLGGTACHHIAFSEFGSEQEIAATVTAAPGGWRLALGDGRHYRHASGTLAPEGTLDADLDGHLVHAVWHRSGRDIYLFRRDEPTRRFVLRGPEARAQADTSAARSRLTAPMPGRIVAVLVAPGTKIGANEPVLVIEAMKMEHMLRAPSAGLVKEFTHAVGDQVTEGTLLVTFEPDAG